MEIFPGGAGDQETGLYAPGVTPLDSHIIGVWLLSHSDEVISKRSLIAFQSHLFQEVMSGVQLGWPLRELAIRPSLNATSYLGIEGPIDLAVANPGEVRFSQVFTAGAPRGTWDRVFIMLMLHHAHSAYVRDGAVGDVPIGRDGGQQCGRCNSPDRLFRTCRQVYIRGTLMFQGLCTNCMVSNEAFFCSMLRPRVEGSLDWP